MPSAWTLANVDERHAANPKTFHVPPLWRRQQFAPGTVVKLLFEDDGGGERLWVRVQERSDGRYRGTLDADPVAIAGLRRGARVDFGPEHIADWIGPTLPEIPATVTAALTQALRDPNRFPRFVRRETPLDAQDSGLRLSWSRDDAAASSRLLLRDVLVFYESLAPLATVRENGRWRWNDADCRYEPER